MYPAQAAVADLPELKGTVKFVRTCEFWEPEVEEMVNQGVWKGPDWVKFYNVGSDRGYHYLGSARVYFNGSSPWDNGDVKGVERAWFKAIVGFWTVFFA